MDSSNARDFKIRQAMKNLLPALNKSAHLAAFRCLLQGVQIRAGDEDRLLCRCNDQAVQRSVFLDGIEVIVQIIESSGVKNIRAGFGSIEREYANLIVAGLAPNH